MNTPAQIKSNMADLKASQKKEEKNFHCYTCNASREGEAEFFHWLGKNRENFCSEKCIIKRQEVIRGIQDEDLMKSEEMDRINRKTADGLLDVLHRGEVE